MTFDGRYTNGSQPQAGLLSVTISSGQSSGFVDITFDVPFDAAPVVVATSGSANHFAYATNITTTGCRIGIRQYQANTTGSTQDVSWTATAKTQ